MFSRLLMLAGVVLLSAVFIHCSLYDDLGNTELMNMKERNKILRDKLISEKCPASDSVMGRRSLLGVSEDGLRLEVEEELYGKLLGMLIKCRKDKIPPTTTTTTTPTSIPSTTTSNPLKTKAKHSTTTMSTTRTAMVLQSTECQNAISLTESWRMDNQGSGLNGKPNCDTLEMKNAGRPWFRFAGAAGSRLLNTCPRVNSCGTNIGIWSDESMPEDVGVVTAITAYGSWMDGCKQFLESVFVIRCSHRSNDFVYKYEGSTGCDLGFCGMN